MKSDKRIYEELGKRLKARRIELGLTQTEVGKRIGVNYTVILMWEKGKKGMSVRTLIALCEALELRLELIKVFHFKKKE